MLPDLFPLDNSWCWPVLRERVVGPASTHSAAHSAALETSLRASLASLEFAVVTERGRFLTLTQTHGLAWNMLDNAA